MQLETQLSSRGLPKKCYWLLDAAAWAFTKVFQAATEKPHLEFLALYDHTVDDEGISSQGGEGKEIIYGPSNSLFIAVIQVLGFLLFFSLFFAEQ